MFFYVFNLFMFFFPIWENKKMSEHIWDHEADHKHRWNQVLHILISFYKRDPACSEGAARRFFYQRLKEIWKWYMIYDIWYDFSMMIYQILPDSSMMVHICPTLCSEALVDSWSHESKLHCRCQMQCSKGAPSWQERRWQLWKLKIAFQHIKWSKEV